MPDDDPFLGLRYTTDPDLARVPKERNTFWQLISLYGSVREWGDPD